ncbi:hypothetical protein WPG_3459 [Winogradskyella sp. PG-2]|nr:hypothetical protein WPG_3459 [Winogradskyella sp. PG-2]
MIPIIMKFVVDKFLKFGLNILLNSAMTNIRTNEILKNNHK